MARRTARVDTVTITFGDRAENHAGMQQLGAGAASGFTHGELLRAAQLFREQGCECQLLDLVSEAGVEALGGGPEPAYLLVVRGGIGALLSQELREDGASGPPVPSPAPVPPPAPRDLTEETRESREDDGSWEVFRAELVEMGLDPEVVDGIAPPAEEIPDEAPPVNSQLADLMLDEQRSLDFDKKALFRGQVKNSLARWNLCFDTTAQEPDYAAGKGRTVAFADVEYTRAAWEALPTFFGEKARTLVAEGNYYYDAKKCGIGFHGDGERKIVIALRLGVSIPLHYQWYLQSKPEGRRIAVTLRHGDLYAMSEKAVGSDWRSRSFPTLRHAAGAAKYLAVKK
jgi:hypothetical protein